MTINFVLGVLLVGAMQAFAAPDNTDWDVECGRKIEAHLTKYQPEKLGQIQGMRVVGNYVISAGPNKELIIQNASQKLMLSGTNLNCTKYAVHSSAASVLPTALSQVLSRYQISYDELIKRANHSPDPATKDEYSSLFRVLTYCRAVKDSWTREVIKSMGFDQINRGGDKPVPGTAM